MARISTYDKDLKVNPEDKWIGSDANNGFATKNFTARDVAFYLNQFNEVGVGSQINFEFVIDLTEGVLPGTIAVGTGNVNNLPISTVTQLRINKFTVDGKVILDYLQYLVNEEIILFNTADRNNFGHFKFVSLQEESENVYIANLELIAANGVLVDGRIYGFGLFLKGSKDKHYRHIQGASSSVWTINHGLQKFPAVVVKDSAGTIVIGEIDYVDTNNVTLTFSGAFSGEAYLN
jgi:hypothetical protein